MDEKNVKNKKNNSNDVPFSKAYCRFFLGLCRFVRPFLHGVCKKSKAFKRQKKNGAMLIVCNHLSAYDFIHFSSAMYGAPLNFVVAENMMYSMPIFAKLLGSYHAITKKQYFADIACVKSIKKYLDSGISVLVCPEGKVSANGVTGAIAPSIARLVQWLGYPVGVIKMQGASLARPKWAYNLRFVRRGKIITNCDMLFSAEETKKLPKDEIYRKICDALYQNEHKWQIDNGIVFKGRRYAEGLDRLLYRCPKCGTEFNTTTSGNRWKCNECGNEVVYTYGGKLIPQGESVCPERIDLWYDEQRKCAAEEVKNDDFRISNTVNLFVENEASNGYRFVANGTLTLDKEKLCFDTDWVERPVGVKSKYGVNNMSLSFDDAAEIEPVEDEFKHVEFVVSRCDTVANLPGTAMDMYDDKHVYRFMFDKVMAATKYALCIEEAYKLENNKH